jgi:hypothetical protein
MTQLSAANVPSGTYYLRVSAIDLSGEGPASNEVAVSVGGACTLPAAPAALTVAGGVLLRGQRMSESSAVRVALDFGFNRSDSR